MEIEKILSLYKLNQHIKRVVALNYPTMMWVKAEVNETSVSNGNYYLHLLERDSDTEEIIASTPAMIWKKDYIKIYSSLKGNLLDQLLQSGREIACQVEISYHERYGLKLFIKAIDPNFTIGQIALQRQALLNTLAEEYLLEKNKQTHLPAITQRIAVLSATTAAGFQDFARQLRHNEWGYAYNISLFEVALQGVFVEKSVLQKLAEVEARKEEFDCVVIIRGGGSKLDLAGFDNLPICRAVANFPIPVLTGIGHDRDETAIDEVAHSALKTPTAVADFLITHHVNFESRINFLQQQISWTINQQLQTQTSRLDQLEFAIKTQPQQLIFAAHTQLDYAQQQLQSSSKRIIEVSKKQLENNEKILAILDVNKTLERGYALVQNKEKRIQSVQDIQKGDELELRFHDGKINTTAK